MSLPIHFDWGLIRSAQSLHVSLLILHQDQNPMILHRQQPSANSAVCKSKIQMQSLKLTTKTKTKTTHKTLKWFLQFNHKLKQCPDEGQRKTYLSMVESCAWPTHMQVCNGLQSWTLFCSTLCLDKHGTHQALNFALEGHSNFPLTRGTSIRKV